MNLTVHVRFGEGFLEKYHLMVTRRVPTLQNIEGDSPF
jgi:hypothetical protein